MSNTENLANVAKHIVALSSGNVGIGTTSPAAKLNIKTTDGTNLAMIAGTTIGARYSTDSSGIYIDGTDPTGGVSYQPLFVGGSTWGVRILGATKMAVDSSGNVQVGGTTVANTVGYVNSRTNTRAWVNFTGVTTAAVTASYNVSSVTRNATGDYTLNFTTALADANYIWLGYAERNTPNKQYNNDAFYENSKSSSALNLKITVVGSLSTEDTPRAYVAIFGN